MPERKLKEFTAYEKSTHCNDMPENPKDFLDWWSEKFNLVPKEYRHTTKVETTSVDYYYNVLVTYVRPETAEEAKKREEGARCVEEIKEDRELQMYRRLHKKYGNQNVVQTTKEE